MTSRLCLAGDCEVYYKLQVCLQNKLNTSGREMLTFKMSSQVNVSFLHSPPERRLRVDQGERSSTHSRNCTDKLWLSLEVSRASLSQASTPISYELSLGSFSV